MLAVSIVANKTAHRHILGQCRLAFKIIAAEIGL
jgi:hypothetical protein